jgi:hypothetical protein
MIPTAIPSAFSSPRPRAIGIVMSLAVAAAALPAQVTDPVVASPYGTACGNTLTVADTITGQGHHALQFQLTGTAPFALCAVVLGFGAVDQPLPGTNCRLLADPVTNVLAVAGANGEVAFPMQIPGWYTGSLTAQGASLDANNAIETSGGLDLLFPGTSPTVDPSTTVTYPCWFYDDLVWNYGGDGVGNVTGRTYWPSATCQAADGPPANRPVVVFTHGNGMTHTDHDDLCAHLARNGFVVLSVANGSHLGGSNEGRARQAISYLNGTHAFWQWRTRLNDDVAFSGHSRGGEAAVTAARLCATVPGIEHLAYDVKAVLPIAPTDGGGDNSDPKEVLDGTMARSFLGLYGTHDPDVRGIRLEDPLAGPENTVFAIYDRAGTESSVEGLLLPASNLTKAMVFVRGATHRGFLDACNLTAGGSIGCNGHDLVVRGYLNAFLRWQLLGQSAYRGYFDGGDVPTAVQVAGIETFPQFADQPRRVVDNFEQGGWNVNTRGGSVVASGAIAAIVEDDLWQLEQSSPHDSRGLRIEWSTPGTAYVGWAIPDAVVANVGPARDVSNYDVLALRVAQDYQHAWNPVGQDQDFHVRLFTGNGWSNLVRVSAHGRVPYPTTFVTHPFPYAAGDFTKSALQTIRIPLDAFTGADLSDVRNVYFYFTVAGHTQGAVLVDSLEFSR